MSVLLARFCHPVYSCRKLGCPRNFHITNMLDSQVYRSKTGYFSVVARASPMSEVVKEAILVQVGHGINITGNRR